MTVPSAGLAESIEGRLVTTTGRLDAKPKKAAGGDLSFVLERDGASSVKVMADASSRIEALTGRRDVPGHRGRGPAGHPVGRARWLSHLGPRSGRHGRGCRGRLRLRAHRRRGSPSPGGGAVATVSIARALKITDRTVAIDATVTAPATLLDASGRRIVVQDASGAVELLLPTGSAAPPVGTRIRAEGRIGVAYGAPRLRVERFTVSGSGSVPAPLVLHGMPGAAHEWRLVTVSGRVSSVNKLGDRWRAEVAVGKDRVVVVGQPGAGIPSTTMVEGRTATVTGIARRPAPTASDHRFAVTPRFPADLRVTGQPVAGPNGAMTGGGTTTPSASSAGGATATAVPAAPDADLDDLGRFVGRLVRVGGLVVDLRPDGFTLDDGTAIGRIVLRGAARRAPAHDRTRRRAQRDRTSRGARRAISWSWSTTPAASSWPVIRSRRVVCPSPAVRRATWQPSGVDDPAAGTSRFAGLGAAPWPVDPGAAGVGTLLADLGHRPSP